MKYFYSLFLLLFTTTFSFSNSNYQHDKWNILPKDHYREFTAFVSSFDSSDDSDQDGDQDDCDKYGQPEWVAYEIRKSEKVEKYKRPSWFTDKELFKLGDAPDDKTYKHSGYDRGHLCMKHIASRLGAKADKETHTMLNACPQIHKFNAGIWLHLEKQTEKWANEHGKIWVICGPIWDKGKETTLIGDEGEKQIPVPHNFFKIVAWGKGEELTVKSWNFPHEAIKKVDGKYQLDNYRVSVNQLEKLTGLNFFTSLPDEYEEQLEEN